MAERNYMNYNEVFPILDMINRKVKQMGSRSQHYNFESPMLDGEGRLDTYQWEVESFEVLRDTDNPIDSNVIEQVTIVYRNGAIDTITLTRGLNPPVDSSVPDYEYINNLMITEVNILTKYGDIYQEVIAKIHKEDGYGLFQKVELLYSDDGEHFHEVEEDTVEEVDTDDFYGDGGYSEGYDEEADTAEDYAGTEYLPEDDISPPADGWADGYNPSDPVDVDVDVPITIIPDNDED